MSAQKPADSRTDTEIESEAAAQIIRMEGDATPEERARFEAWRKEDPRHEAACRRLETVWSRAGLLTAVRPPGPPIDADLLKPRGLRKLLGRFAARLGCPHSAIRWTVASLVPIVALGAMAWMSFMPKTYANTDGHEKQVRLEDGSGAGLQPSSLMRVRITEEARVVELESGGVRFDVVKDPKRPFDVRTGQKVLRAKGTNFLVNRLDTVRFHLSVKEGSVIVGNPGDEASYLHEDLRASHPTVHAGERAEWDGKRVRIYPNPRRSIRFVDRALDDALREFNLFYDKPMRIETDSLYRGRITANFAVSNREGFLHVLAQQDILSEDRGDAIVLFR